VRIRKGAEKAIPGRGERRGEEGEEGEKGGGGQNSLASGERLIFDLIGNHLKNVNTY
jgi:hypothetical protein